jgi:hypothetical protein
MLMPLPPLGFNHPAGKVESGECRSQQDQDGEAQKQSPVVVHLAIERLVSGVFL